MERVDPNSLKIFANIQVKRFIRTLQKVLHTTTHWKQDRYQFLDNYRATTHFTTGVAFATALFGWPIRTKLPNTVLVPSAANHDPVTMRHIGAQEKLRIKSQAELSKIVTFRLETQY